MLEDTKIPPENKITKAKKNTIDSSMNVVIIQDTVSEDSFNPIVLINCNLNLD